MDWFSIPSWSLHLLLIAFLCTPWVVQGENDEKDVQHVVTCPEGATSLTFAGDEHVMRLTQAWHTAYRKHCPDVNIALEGGDYPMGASRVCGENLIYSAVDMAGMLGAFFHPQASTMDGWSFQCKRSQRKTILLQLGHEGIHFNIASKGAVAECMEKLGGGLSLDQLRWMYSAYNEDVLAFSGWDEASVPNSDGNDATHLWSELHENCTATEILIAGTPRDGTGAYSFLSEHIFHGLGEQARDYHVSLDYDDLKSYVESNPTAIAFSEFQGYGDNGAITVVPLSKKNGQDFVDPLTDALDNTVPYPLIDTMYLGVHDDPSTLPAIRSFIEFGLSEEGSQVLKEAGFSPIHDWEKMIMYTRLKSKLGLDLEGIKGSCGPEHGLIQGAGSVTVLPVFHMWKEFYNLGCPTVEFSLAGGGSSTGAGRVCANLDKGQPVNVGMMSREWKSTEAHERQGFVYDCLKGDSSRSAIQIDVALDGITVFFAQGGVGQKCLETMGGLTLDQLRWIYSSYNEEQLEETGWDPSCLGNSDHNPNTHLWSELDSRCPSVEIRLTGDPVTEGTFAIFTEKVLQDKANGETIAQDRPNGYFNALGSTLLSHVLEHGEAISYLGFVYYYENKDLVWAAPLRNHKGNYVLPSKQSIGEGNYPISRSIYMNILNDERELQHVVPWLRFGFAHPELTSSSGFAAVIGDAREEMLRRLDGAPYNKALQGNNDDLNEDSFWMIIVSIVAGLLFCCGMWVLCIRTGNNKS